jgi:CDP-diacylglycerol--glycerol-3-phosphate 3-phosphatidyltransferase
LIDLAQLRHKAAQHSTEPIVNLLCRTRLTPNTLTILGFLGSLVAASLIALEYLFIGGLLVLLSGAFDLFDGALARAKNQTTSFGAFLDSTLDRISEAALLFGLLVLYHLTQPSNPEVWLIYAALVGSILVSYMRARAEGLGIKCEVGVFTRAERVIVLALGLLLSRWIDISVLIALCIIAALAWVTVIQRFIYVRQQTNKEPKGSA